MATRFTASEARLKAEAAQRAIEEERERSAEKRRLQTKQRAIVKKGFMRQRVQVLSAAIDMQTEISFDRIFLYQNYVKVGLQVVEIGMVKRRRPKSLEGANIKGLKYCLDTILEIFDKFIESSKEDTTQFYPQSKAFYNNNRKALFMALNSRFLEDDFIGDEIFVEKVPESMRQKYRPYFKSINRQMISFKNGRRGAVFDAEFDLEDDDRLVRGEYVYDSSDFDVDLLQPTNAGNTLTIRWDATESLPLASDPLLSKVGLAWLCTCNGQTLIQKIFELLSDAAESGRNNLSLEFTLSDHKWFLIDSNKRIPCCLPGELIEIIKQENFLASGSSSIADRYSIMVSW